MVINCKNIYRKACVTSQEADFNKFHEADKCIKREICKRKWEYCRKFTEKMDSDSTGEKAKGLGHILRIKNGYRKKKFYKVHHYTRRSLHASKRKILLPRGPPIFCSYLFLRRWHSRTASSEPSTKPQQGSRLEKTIFFQRRWR